MGIKITANGKDGETATGRDCNVYFVDDNGVETDLTSFFLSIDLDKIEPVSIIQATIEVTVSELGMNEIQKRCDWKYEIIKWIADNAEHIKKVSKDQIGEFVLGFENNVTARVVVIHADKFCFSRWRTGHEEKERFNMNVYSLDRIITELEYAKRMGQ